jgi:hypothetical protein
MKTKRYDELTTGDVIWWYGAKERVLEVRIYPAPANEWYPSEKLVRFDLEPVDKESEKILGRFYSHGTYGGVGCLKVSTVEE